MNLCLPLISFMAVPNASRQRSDGRPARVLCPRCHSFETMCGWEHKGSSFYLCRNCECTWAVSERSDWILSDVIAALNLGWQSLGRPHDVAISKDAANGCPPSWFVNHPLGKPS
jgi:hypothetical protein